MKVAIILDRDLPPGLSSNAAAALAFSVSPLLPDCVGGAVPDASGEEHAGITNVPLPVLAASADSLAALRKAVARAPGAACIDFSDIARRSKNYADYAESLRATRPDDIAYLGLCIYGEDKAVRSLTGSLALFGK
jgi:hypothetical protein